MAKLKTRLNDGQGDNALDWGRGLLGIQLSGNSESAPEGGTAATHWVPVDAHQWIHSDTRSRHLNPA
jgi:hypothetical protein